MFLESEQSRLIYCFLQYFEIIIVSSYDIFTGMLEDLVQF